DAGTAAAVWWSCTAVPARPSWEPRRWFFFSSRRRHTRSKRDWSSDVCSSDLLTLFIIFLKINIWILYYGKRRLATAVNVHRAVRSEERRVGKECRTWWATATTKIRTRRGA